MLFAVKLVHSLIIIYMFACLYLVWVYALTGYRHRFLRVAFVSIIAEIAVFVMWDFECPLTIWALALGDPTGADLLSDIFHLQGVEYTTNFGIFFAIACLLSLRRIYQARSG